MAVWIKRMRYNQKIVFCIVLQITHYAYNRLILSRWNCTLSCIKNGFVIFEESLSMATSEYGGDQLHLTSHFRYGRG